MLRFWLFQEHFLKKSLEPSYLFFLPEKLLSGKSGPVALMKIKKIYPDLTKI
jgi:hypothetical protein